MIHTNKLPLSDAKALHGQAVARELTGVTEPSTPLNQLRNTPTLPNQIYIIPSFHYDVAYLKTYREYLPVCFDIINEALRILEMNPQYRFLIEQVILLQEFWEQFPQTHEPLRRLARQGRLGVGPGMFVMPDMNHPCGETMFLQVRFGKEWLSKTLEIEPNVCWIADCWGHHAQLPQILRLSGYEYYVFYRGMRRDVMLNDFRWQGLDGTRINTHWLASGYANVRFPTKAEVVNAADLELVGCGPEQLRALALELAAHGPSDICLLCNGGDFAHPQASGPQAVRQLNAMNVLPPIQFALPQEALGQIDWQNKAVVAGEFNSLFQGSFTSNIGIKQQVRQLANRLLALETLGVVATDSTPHDCQSLWPAILKQQFHDILCGTICDGALAECLAELRQARQAIDAESAQFSPKEGIPVAFNPTSFPRTEIITHQDRRLKVNLPALGFSDLRSAQEMLIGQPAALPVTFDNEYYRASVGEKGYITSLVEKSSGMQLVAPQAAPFGCLGMQIDNGDLWSNFDAPLNGGSVESSLNQNHGDPLVRKTAGGLLNHGTFFPSIARAAIVVQSEHELIVEQEGTLSFWRLRVSFKTRIHFTRHSPRIDYDTTFVTTGKQYRVRAIFPSAIAAGTVHHEIPFGIQQRGSGEHVAQNWVDYSQDACGLALLNRGTPASNVEEGILMLTLFRAVAMEYKADSDDSFNEGAQHAFAYAILPHARDWKTTVIQHGRAFNFPPILCRTASLARSGEWDVSHDNVLISALRWNGNRIFLRLYEATGQDAKGYVNVPAHLASWCRADGIERPTGPLQACEGRIPFALRAFEVQGFLLSAR